jgi:(4S)-4-hydroxy-5-phosphonooxypentane-2,3-dione isomerase
MIIVHVYVHVKPEHVEAFKSATVDNARHSLLEAGIARFDVLQHSGDPCRFVLVEAYWTAEAPAQHKQTAHYAKWRDAVAPMMAEARSSTAYYNTFPDDPCW